jgi:protein-S-isoprenylcysteine O-methyltransferase Ste14
MPSKMNVLGVGPRLASYSLPGIILVICLNLVWPGAFEMQASNHVTRTLAVIFGVCFLLLYLPSARMVLKGVPQGRLLATGPYALCRHPLYASFILFLAPALAFGLRNWLVLLISVNGYAAFKALVSRENTIMQKTFGKKYASYQARVNEFIPLPRPRSMLARVFLYVIVAALAAFVVCICAVRP